MKLGCKNTSPPLLAPFKEVTDFLIRETLKKKKKVAEEIIFSKPFLYPLRTTSSSWMW